MKTMKRTLALLLCFVMVVAVFPATAFAAGGEPNVTVTIDKTAFVAGDTVTVTLGVKEFQAASVAFGFDFDTALLEVTSITAARNAKLNYKAYDPDAEEWYDDELKASSVSTKAEANNSGHVGAVWVNTDEVTYLEKESVITVKFTALADGAVVLNMFEDSSGTGSHKGDWTVGTPSDPEPPAHECTPGAVSYEVGENGQHTKIVACADPNCDKIYSSTVEDCSGGKADCENKPVCEFCHNPYGEAKGHGKTNGFRYVHNDGTDTHDVICADCNQTIEKDVACTFENGSHVCKFACGNETDCADNNSDHNCDVCGEKLTDCADNNNDHDCDVCGTELSKCSDKTGDQNHDCDVCGKPGITECAGGTATCLNPAVCSECGQEHGKIDPENHVGEKTTTYIDNGDDHTVKVYYSECEHEISSTNEPHNYGDDFVCDDCGHELAGWVEKDGNWYYVENGKPVTGNVRVPYHKDYAPNAEDVAYAQANAESKYTDAETAVFVFDENGVFQSDFTGIIDGNRYAVDGVIAWHVGLVEIDGEYYYFIGDVNGGGNIAAEGDVYVSRFNGIPGFKAKEVYNFVNGKLSGLNGLVDRYGDGKLFYYENSKLMLGNGLTQFGEELIYVRSNGQIAIGKYWVAKTNGLCNPGMYTFGDDGFLQSSKNPNVNGLVDGVYYKDGMPYYAGLIEIDGDTYYINSAGEVVTGTYYVTKLDNYTGDLNVKRGDKLTFGTDGKLVIE